MTRSTLTRELENRKMLAVLLGIDEEEAEARLEARVLVTPAADKMSRSIAIQIQAMLSRTVNAVFDGDRESAIAVEVIVGPAEPRSAAAVRIWVGAVRGGLRIAAQPFDLVPNQEHAVFGLIAACYACGMALRFALGRGLFFAGSDSILVSPSRLLGDEVGLLSIPCDVGEAVLAGAGAVGNGFLYGLQHFQPIGRLHVVDPKYVHDGILNRCMWFEASDIGEAKAIAIARHAQPSFSALELVPRVATVRDVARDLAAPGIQRLITTVDSRRARRSLQNEIPKEVFDASTTGATEVVLHFNEQPTSLACLGCIYREEEAELQHEAHVAEALGVSVKDVRTGFVDHHAAAQLCSTFQDLKPEDVLGKAYDTLFKARCAQGTLRTAADRQVLAPFSFVSVLAGAYLALELVRRVNSSRTAEPYNYWRVSPWHNPVPALRALRQVAPGCHFCGSSLMRDTAAELWSSPERLSR